MTTVALLHDTYEGGGWVGLYVDGVLKDQGHSLGEYQVLKALGFEVLELEAPLGEHGDPCPPTLAEARKLHDSSR